MLGLTTVRFKHSSSVFDQPGAGELVEPAAEGWIRGGPAESGAVASPPGGAIFNRGEILEKIWGKSLHLTKSLT